MTIPLLVLALLAPSPLHVKGTQILDARNRPVLLRGVDVASLEWSSDGEGHVLQTAKVAVEDWKANLVRVPLSQDRWFGKAPEQHDDGTAYRALVKKVVDQISGDGAYVILDLHWNDLNEWGQNIGQHVLPDRYSVLFWRSCAAAYKDHPAVIFDLYNEPHDVTWDQWRDGGTVTERGGRGKPPRTYEAVGMQTLLDTVRSTGARNVVLAGGLDWAYDFSGILAGRELKDPKGHGVVYANHAYPFKGETVEKWIARMKAATARFPVVVSEFGSDAKGGAGLDGGAWVDAVMAAMRENRWNFTAWDLHPAAGPVLIKDWSYAPTSWFGERVKRELATPVPK